MQALEWQEIAPMNVSRASALLAYLQGRIFCVSGLEDKDKWSSTIESFDEK